MCTVIVAAATGSEDGGWIWSSLTNWLLFHFQEIAITSSPDTTVRVWAAETGSCRQVIKVKQVEVGGAGCMHAVTSEHM